MVRRRVGLVVSVAFAVGLLAAGQSVAGEGRPVAAMLDFPPADVEAGLALELTQQLEAAGYSVRNIDAGVLCDSAKLTAERFDMLVLPNAGVLPARSMRPVEQYLRGGGDLISLRTPMWQRPLIEVNDRWTTREGYARTLAGKLPENVLFSFEPATIAKWQRSSNHPEFPTRYETVAEGPAPGQRALHAVMPNLDGWDVYGLLDLKKPFPDGHTLTVFSAKGGPRTTRLVIEWVEKDGSRWMAVVPLGTEWSLIALPPEAFVYWPSVPARVGTRFRPENALRMTVGLAFSHSGQIGGRHEFWVGPFGTAPLAPVYAPLVDDFTPPVLDTLSPTWKLFECTDVGRLFNTIEYGSPPENFPLAREIRSPHPRPRGGGFDKGRTWRFIPLLHAMSSGDVWRGNPATLLVHADGPYKNGAWASFGVQDPEWYRSPKVLGVIGKTARRIREGIFLLDGGADHYTYPEGHPIRMGLRLVNITRSERTGLSADIDIIVRKGPGPDMGYPAKLNLLPGLTKLQIGEWKPPGRMPTELLVITQVTSGREVIDGCMHDVEIELPRKAGDKHFVTVRDGEFMLDGKRWRAHGVNYMPSSGIGLDDYDMFEHWLGSRAYDPEIIQRDLEHIKELGMNAVSIFIDHRSIKAENLFDFLRRLDALGMKANLSLRPGSPMDFQWDKIREIIEHYRLAECDTIFAYDLAWEPMWRGHAERKPYDREWEAWVVERYGSIESAEKEWGFKAPREAGRVTNPLAHQIDTDGEWRRMVAAYRRFLDTLLYQRYGAARRLARSIDRNHLVSFRMTEAGDPTFKVDGWMVYDFPYLAGAVDMLAPEAYGRLSADWERVKPAIFEAEYGRWAAPDKPFIWAESGVSAWDMARERPEPSQLEYQAAYYGHFYRAIIESSADGVFHWWYPGGFRGGENSDFGAINPDGTDRPVTKVIREHARKFLEGPSAKPVDHWIEFDRDAHTDGITGVYNKVKDEFWKAVAEGKTPGLRTAGTGTDSTNCPALAVGNTPWNGTNPPKYLDAAFNSVEVLAADGKWTKVGKGGHVKVRADQAVLARIELSNPGEARWVDPATAGQKPGGVYLIVKGQGQTSVPIKGPVPRFGSEILEQIELVPANLKNTQELTLTMEAYERTLFGERFRITLEPQ